MHSTAWDSQFVMDLNFILLNTNACFFSVMNQFMLHVWNGI